MCGRSSIASPTISRFPHGRGSSATYRNLHLTGRLTAGTSRVSLHDIEAHAGSYDIYAAAVRSHERTKAAILVKLGAFAIGIDVNGDDKHVVILGAPGWFHARVAKGKMSR